MISRFRFLVIASCGILAIQGGADELHANQLSATASNLQSSTASADGAVSAQPTPAINFQVLSRQEVNLGSHSIIYNRVAPPVVPAVTPSPLLQPQPVVQESLLPPKDCRVIFLSATVVDHHLTLLKQLDGNQTFQAVSNIDFNQLDGIGDIETADAVYTFLLILDNQTTDALASQGDVGTPALVARARQLLSRKTSAYVVAAGGTGASDYIAALDALHAYYDANKERLIRDYQTRITQNARPEQKRPTVEPDTVINFWPIKSRVYLKGGIP